MSTVLLQQNGALAQDDASTLVVGFVVDSTLNTASVSDVGPDGLSKLADIFRSMGATTEILRLDEEIAPEVDVVVLIGPRTAISDPIAARLWQFIVRGGHLLLAFDASGFAGTRGENATSGFNTLLSDAYALGLQNGLLVSPWFTQELLEQQDVNQTLVLAQPEPVIRHPVVAPLVDYEMPVQVWGGRSVFVEAQGGFSHGSALLYTDHVYSEQSAIANGVELNINQDLQGRLLTGALAENETTGSRIALFGDSQIFMNRYGLEFIRTTDLPLFPGNTVLAQRLAAWLIGLPEDQWPELPQPFTWLIMDGDRSDWTEDVNGLDDSLFDATAGQQNLQRVEAFYNGQFLYATAELSNTPNANTAVTMTFTVNGETREILLNSEQIFLVSDGERSIIPDAGFALDTVIELRLPLRITGTTPVIERLCLSTTGTQETGDCLDDVLPAQEVIAFDPVQMRFPPGPTVIIQSSSGGANLRTGPSTGAAQIILLFNGNLMAAIGRDESSQWIKVANGRFEGWIANGLVELNTNLENLPIAQ